MEKPRKHGTLAFEEESYAEQAKSINAQFLGLEKAIKANIRRALEINKKNPQDLRLKNLEDLAARLKSYTP